MADYPYHNYGRTPIFNPSFMNPSMYPAGYDCTLRPLFPSPSTSGMVPVFHPNYNTGVPYHFVQTHLPNVSPVTQAGLYYGLPTPLNQPQTMTCGQPSSFAYDQLIGQQPPSAANTPGMGQQATTISSPSYNTDEYSSQGNRDTSFNEIKGDTSEDFLKIKKIIKDILGNRVKQVIISKDMLDPWSPPTRYNASQGILEINPNGWTMALLTKKFQENTNQVWDPSIRELVMLMYKYSLLASHYSFEEPITQPKPHHLQIGLLNANTAENKVTEIHGVIQNYFLDILVINETNMKDAKKLAPFGYKVIEKCRSGQSGGGVAIIYKGKKINYVTEYKESETNYQSFEAVTVQFTFDGIYFILVGLYRPSSSSAKSKFFDDFYKFLDEISVLRGELLICGDFNCPGVTNVSVDEGLETELRCHGLSQIVTKPTRLNNLLDLFICKKHMLKNVQVWTYDPDISDHHLVAARIDLELYAQPSIINHQETRFNETTETALIKISDDILSGMNNQLVTHLVSHKFSTPIRIGSEQLEMLCADMVNPLQSSLHYDVSSNCSIEEPFCYVEILLEIGELLKLVCYTDSESIVVYSTFAVSSDSYMLSILTLQIFSEVVIRRYEDTICKREAIYFGTRQQLNKLERAEAKAEAKAPRFDSDVQIPVSKSVKVLGVVLDELLSMNDHISNIVYMCNEAKHLEYDKKEMIKNRIKEELDYSVLLIHGCQQKHTNRMLKVLEELDITYNLPVKFTIKIIDLAYQIIKNEDPKYLLELLKWPSSPGRGRLRSHNNLQVPIKAKVAERCFSYAAPKAWNSLTEGTKKGLRSLSISSEDLPGIVIKDLFLS